MTRGRAFDRCLGLEVSGPFAHFRQVGGNSTRQTYRIMPRTTVAGMLAAIVGRDRDSYYDAFAKDVSAVAVVPTTPLQTTSVPKSELGTDASNDLGDVGDPIDKELGITTVSRDAMDSRQRNPYQMLRDVAYRIYVALDDESFYESLQTYLAEGRSHYTPTLGLSECIASVQFLGECRIEPADVTKIDSALPGFQTEVIPEEGVRYSRERAPGFMEAVEDGRGRRTTEFIDTTYRADGGPIMVGNDVPAQRVASNETSDTVVFV